jgi:VanZ family protein
MGFILVMTSWPKLDLPVLEASGDKVAHFSAYLVLGLLSARAAMPSARSWRSAVAVVAMIAVLAMLDEVHQAWIPGRFPELLDWFADIGGGIAGTVLAPLLFQPAPRRPRSDL